MTRAITMTKAAFALLACVLVALLLAACSGGGQGAPSQGSPVAAGDDLIVRFVEIDQGDCAIISCQGHHMIIDGGVPDRSRKVHAILDTLGIERLDAMVATHPDSDHVGGLQGALERSAVDVCYCSTDTSDTSTFARFVEKLSEVGCPLVIPQPGDSFALGGATVTFVGPVRHFDDDNDGSLVLRIDYGDTSFLFTADAKRDSEFAMLDAGANLDADVLKVAHHGSNSSSANKFLAAVSPEYAVISCGKNNDYGYPSPKVLDRLQKAGAQVLRTDLEDCIIFTSDGTNLSYTATDYIDF